MKNFRIKFTNSVTVKTFSVFTTHELNERNTANLD